MQSFARRTGSVLFAVLSILSLGAAAFLTAAVLTGYDRNLHHFDIPHPFFTLAVIFCVLGALLSLALALLARAKKIAAAPTESGPVVFAGALVGFLLLFSFILSIPHAGTWSDRIYLAVMALSAFYFLMLTQRASVTPVRALLSLFPIVYGFLSVLRMYFDASMSMNAPLKSYYLMMYLSMALFFTAEARAALHRFRLPSYCLFAGLCVILCGSAGIALTVSALLGFALSLSLQQGILTAAVAVYAALRLFSLKSSDAESPAESPVPEA